MNNHLLNFTHCYRDFIYDDQSWVTPHGRFNNKFAAADSVNGDMNQITFHSDRRWKNVDFSVRPKTNYIELCLARAQQISKHYDYVRLWLSGGLDSYTVLKSFIDSGSRIDEIIIIQKYLRSPTELNNYEEHVLVRGLLKYHSQQLAGVKIRWLDYTGHDLSRHFDIDWTHLCFGHGTFEIRSGITNNNPFFDHPELTEPFDKGRLVADVLGLEKSLVKKINGEWFHVMLDAKFHLAIGRPGAVMFFCDPAFPELYVLDCHIRLDHYDKMYQDNLTRLAHPCYNAVAHKYIRKYYPAKKLSMSEKSVIFEVEASLDAEFQPLIDKFYLSMSNLQKKYPSLVLQDWALTQGPAGHFGQCHSLERDYQAWYHELMP
jgi:hypothetical protein